MQGKFTRNGRMLITRLLMVLVTLIPRKIWIVKSDTSHSFVELIPYSPDDLQYKFLSDFVTPLVVMILLIVACYCQI